MHDLLSFSFWFFPWFLLFFRGFALLLFGGSCLSFSGWFFSRLFLGLFLLWRFLFFLLGFLLFFCWLFIFLHSLFLWLLFLFLGFWFNTHNSWFFFFHFRGSLIKIFLHLLDGSKTMRNCILNFFRKFSICLVISFWFKIGIPTKISASTGFNNFPWSSPDK